MRIFSVKIFLSLLFLICCIDLIQCKQKILIKMFNVLNIIFNCNFLMVMDFRFRNRILDYT